VHVADLAEAHVLAMRAMEAEETVHVAYNLGNGDGFTVLEVVDAVRRVTGRRPRTRSAPRRAGDPAVLVASSERARRELGWKPAYPSLDAILETAWRWHREHPAGYDGA
jgi:UDP-glucose 4-epimerase